MDTAMHETKPGEIITFYSYKGGTGRTMALANTACLLAEQLRKNERRPRILAIDWDFEAPGLHRYFLPYMPARTRNSLNNKLGCLDFFEALNKPKYLKQFNLRDVVGNRKVARDVVAAIGLEKYTIELPDHDLFLMKAGKFDNTYGRRVSAFDWVKFFGKTPGFFSGFADYLRENFDYVLVDSRTGVTDASGICTALLPDKLVAVFTPNNQSLGGLDEVVRQAVNYRKQSADWRSLIVFPLPSRIEQARPSLLEKWRHGGKPRPGEGESFLDNEGFQPLFERMFREIYGQDACNLGPYFDQVMLQHIPDYAYGEPIAVLEEKDDSRISLRSAYQTFLSHLTELPGPWVSLATARAEKQTLDLCDEAHTRIATGRKEEAQRIGLLLLEQSPASADLFDQVFETLLAIVDACFPDKQAVYLLGEIHRRASGMGDAELIERSQKLTSVGERYLRFGRYAEAREIFEATWDDLKANAPEEHQDILAAMNYYAETLLRLGQLGKAAELLQRAIDLGRETLGEEHPITLVAMNHLAATRYLQGDLLGARELGEKALELCRQVLGEEDPDTLKSMNNLVNTLQSQGDLSGARELGEKVLELRSRILGKEHPETLASMNNLANTLRAQGDLLGARTLQEQGLDTLRQILGEKHPATLASMGNLANTLQSQGDLPGARLLQEKVLEISRHVLGGEHPNTLNSMGNLANILQLQGDLPGARVLQEKVLEISRRVLGEEHPDTLSLMGNLANTLQLLGVSPDARDLQEKALEISCRMLGEEHPKTLVLMGNLANSLRSQGDLPDARALQEKVLEISSRVLGEKHPDTLRAMNGLANTLRVQGDLADARTLQEYALELRRQTLGEGHPDTLASMNGLSDTLRAQLDLLGARSLQEKALDLSRRLLGPGHPLTFSTLNGLLQTLEKQGDTEASGHLREEIELFMSRVLSEERGISNAMERFWPVKR